MAHQVDAIVPAPAGGATASLRAAGRVIGPLRAALRSGAFLTTERVIAYARVFLVLELGALVILTLIAHGAFDKDVYPMASDFVSFYAAGQLAHDGHAPLVYDIPSHYAAEQAATGLHGFGYLAFFYPPIFLLICVLISRLPYIVAICVWLVTSMTGYLAVVRAILGSSRYLVLFAAFAPVFLEIVTGQNAFVTASLFGAGTYFLARRPILAGICFGALCYKPHFGLLIPVALVAGGHWRSVAAAAATCIVLSLVAAWAFGIDSWQTFLALSTRVPGSFAQGKVHFAGLVSPFGAARLLGAPIPVAWILQGITVLGAAAMVFVTWRRSDNLAARNAVLISATLIAMPVVLFYDLVLAGIAIAWIMVDARRTGFYPWEKLILGAVFLTPLLVPGLGHRLHLPLGPVFTLSLLALAMRRAFDAKPAGSTGATLVPSRQVSVA